MVKITFLDLRILAPLILVFVVIGAYTMHENFTDVIAAFIFGGLGYGAKWLGYPRVPIVLGFILGKLAEKYFIISINTYGAFFVNPLYNPIAFVILLVILATVVYDIRSRSKSRKRERGIA